MKKTLVTLAVAAATGAAFAQSTVTISGGVAAAYERSSAAGSDAVITGYDASSNNVTFKGTEDLGGGLKVSFELNKRFNLATGALGSAALTSGQTDYRDFENSFVTVSGGFGEVRAGRHSPVSLAGYDAFGGLGVDFKNKNAGSAAKDYGYNNVSASRYDSAISYTTPNFNGFSATFGRTQDPAINTGREASVIRLGYANSKLNVAYVYEQVAAKTGATQRNDKNLAATYQFPMVKAYLLWGQEGSTKARTSIGAAVPVGSNVKLLASYRTAGGAVATTETWALGAEYSLSKRSTLFAHYGDYKDSAQSAYRLGIKHTF